jgi:hypothetical protein
LSQFTDFYVVCYLRYEEVLNSVISTSKFVGVI